VDVIGEWTAARKYRSTICPLHCLFKSAFGITRWVGQRKYDRIPIYSGHLLHDSLVENSTNGRQAHKNCGLDVVDNVQKMFELLSSVVVTAEIDLVLGKFVAAVVGD
jgi:hypothetical protein